ncbi:MAG: hypothetical protein ACREFR_11575 [Limisphaerales bacterium]
MNRYVPLAVWIIVISAIILIPLKIFSYGFLPMDDALRHAAKTISGKSWEQILVMRADFTIDPSPGWQKILEWVHDLRGGDAQSLVVFSFVSLMILVMICGAPWFRRPEAWLAALCAASIFIPQCTTRFARGRPYILTDAILITILFLWSRQDASSGLAKKVTLLNRVGAASRGRFISAMVCTTLLAAASAWIHGAWYLLALPGVAVLLTGLWREAIVYWICWLVGSFLGSALTGHPIGFLAQEVRHALVAFGNFAVNRQLEPEWYPSDGSVPAILAVAALLLWRKMSGAWNVRAILNPMFMMMALGWLLGLHTRRFWWDFGTPAFIAWVALELQEHFARESALDSFVRLVATLAIAAGAYWGFTSDRQSRWTQNLSTDFVSPATPGIAGWLPGPGGIIYNSDMDVFYTTFFKNPTADWRYVLGFEPGLMRPEDLKVFRKYQLNFGDPRALEPWVDKMRPPDRMFIAAPASSRPDLPRLQWYYAATELWIGRLPPAGENPAVPQK